MRRDGNPSARQKTVPNTEKMKNILIYPDRKTCKILTESETWAAIEDWRLNHPQRTGEGMFSITPFLPNPGEGICGEPHMIPV
jgi:hypothetical protein